MFKKQKTPIVAEKELSTIEYLNNLSDKDLNSHTFKGFKLELTMISGNKYSHEFYCRGYNPDVDYLINELKIKRYLLTDEGHELDLKYLESITVVEKLETFYIGQKAWNSITEMVLGTNYVNVGSASKETLDSLLALDNNETLNF